MNDRAERASLARRIGLTQSHAERLGALESTEQIQAFVDAIPMNFSDDTCFGVTEVLRRNQAMCIEGALVAACALLLLGRPPLLLRLYSSDGEDHAVAPFIHRGYWGAISKSNHIWCRGRDPIYQNVRELVMSYAHEYVTASIKTLRGHGDVVDLRCLALSEWVTCPGYCNEVIRLTATRAHWLFDATQAQALRLRDALEMRGNALLDHPPQGDNRA